MELIFGLHTEYFPKYNKTFLLTEKNTIVGELTENKIILHKDYCEKVIENSKDLPACVFSKNDEGEIEVSENAKIEDLADEKLADGKKEIEIIDFEKEKEAADKEKAEIANKLNTEPDGICSVTTIENPETMSRIFGTNMSGNPKIVRFWNNKTMVLDENNNEIIGFESTPASMEIIDALNLGKYAESTIDDKHVSAGKTEGTVQGHNDIIVISKYPNTGEKLVVSNGLDGQTNAEVFKYTNEGLIPLETRSIFPSNKDIIMYAQSDKVKDVKQNEEMNDISEMEHTENDTTEEIRKKLEKIKEEKETLKEQYNGKQVSASEMQEVADQMEKLNSDEAQYAKQLKEIEGVALETEKMDEDYVLGSGPRSRPH